VITIHLFSTPGKDDIHYVLDACRPHLKGKNDPVVAYLPVGALDSTRQEYTENAFRSLARVETMDTEMQTLPEMEALLRRAALVYIPGGNTFYLNHRLHSSKIVDFLRKKILAGLPMVAFSAGTVLCGPNILTSNNINILPTPHFKGLDITPFNFNVHYPEDPLVRAIRDDWLGECHAFHDNPVIMLSDGAYVQIEGKKTVLMRGEAWILRKGHEKQALPEGEIIPINIPASG
jgi:dipeptidase E